MTKTIEPGTVVIDGSGTEYIYDGPGDDGMPGMVRVIFDFRSKGPNKIQCDADQVAPADVAETVNLKDGRILVTKLLAKPAFAAGQWRHLVVLADGTTHTGYHKTKRDGTAEAAHRLAIADWHADA